MLSFTEDTFEQAVIELFENMGYTHIYAPDMNRTDYNRPLLDDVLRDCLVRLNRSLPAVAIDEAILKLNDFDAGSLLQKNIIFMGYLQNGITVKYAVKGEERSSVVKLIDYADADKNDFYVVNQYTFVENGNNRRPDIILFINGLPLVLMELKSPSKDEVGAENAYNQIRNYMKDIPSMFYYNAVCVISDLSTNKAGTITSGLDRFMEWKTKDGDYENTAYAQFDTFYEGMFQKARLLDILKNFILFSGDGQKPIKILAGYHQYFAVRKAIEKAKIATKTDGKGGVFWHTQGSGKSLSMVFYAQINELLKASIQSQGVISLFDSKKADENISLFDPAVLDEISKMKEKNIAVEILKKLMAEQVSLYKRTNVVQSQKFSEKITQLMNSYYNGLITNEEVIKELLKTAQEITELYNNGKKLGLTQEELAFYDALTKPENIKDFYQNNELIDLTRELTEMLRKNRTIDWQKKETARASMRKMVKHLLKKYKYPPEDYDTAISTVISQCEMWTDNMVV